MTRPPPDPHTLGAIVFAVGLILAMAAPVIAYWWERRP
jgi:hypothetical protein